MQCVYAGREGGREGGGEGGREGGREGEVMPHLASVSVQLEALEGVEGSHGVAAMDHHHVGTPPGMNQLQKGRRESASSKFNFLGIIHLSHFVTIESISSADTANQRKWSGNEARY